MKRYERILLYGSGCVMEISWLYAWVAFSLVSLGGAPLPVIRVAALFIAGAAISRILHCKGLRVATLGIMHVLGIFAALLWTMHYIVNTRQPIVDLVWLAEFFLSPHQAIEWLCFVLAVFWTAAIWLSGVFFSLRPATHEKVSSRFDIGLAAFLSLVLIKFAIEMKGGLSVQNNLSVTSACIFFFFGLFAIGITRAHGLKAVSLVEGHRKIGIVLGFISAVFFSVISMVVFLRQPLSDAAGMGYGLLAKAGSFAGSVFIGFIKFLYFPKRAGGGVPPSGGQDSMFDHISSAGGGAWMETAGKIFAWLVGSFMGLVVIVLIITAAVWTVRWLLSRTEKKDRPVRQSFNTRAILKRIAALLTASIRHFGRSKTAAGFYRALKVWSRLSGIQPMAHETPSEFSRRVRMNFPVIKLEIDTILHAFNREFYGDATLSRDEIKLIHSSWRKIASPRLWPGRLKTLVRGTVNLRS